MRIGDLVPGDDPWPHTRERVGALVAARIADPGVYILDLRGVITLRMYGPIMKRVLSPHGRRSDVVMDGVAENVVVGVRGTNGLCRPTDDDRELRLGMGAA